ncbi:MAG TPA: hypothetical protein VEF04_19765 [Blastocatellia bacterium]|nr:hypothetical protein [Blastocatellia bacterium]
MQTRFQFTQYILTIFVSIALLLQSAQAQISSKQQIMTREQIEAFIMEADKKDWQVTVKYNALEEKCHKGKCSSITKVRKFSGGLYYSKEDAELVITDSHPLMVGPCGAGLSESAKINISDIISIGRRNEALYALRNASEVPGSALFLALAAVVMPFEAIADKSKR